VLNAVGDTVARLLGTNTVGLNTVTWNLQATGATMQGPNMGGRGGFGGAPPATGPINDPGFPAGFNARPAEGRGAPDSTGTPENQATALMAERNRSATPAGGMGGGGMGGGGFGGGGFGGARTSFVDTGDYRIVLELPGQSTPLGHALRVVRVAPDERAVLVPAKR
jgi:hypothetical protein